MSQSVPKSIVLASSSKYRAALLSQLLRPLHTEFTQFSPDIDESAIAGESPHDMAARLSKNKANAVAMHFPDSIIIASDQVPFHPSQHSILRKPNADKNALESAVAQLQRCSGTRVEFHTGLCVLHPNHADFGCQIAVEQFDVVFRTLELKEIERYVTIEKPFDCAGAFKVEGLGISLFERLEGKDHNALIGLPLIQLSHFLRNCELLVP